MKKSPKYLLNLDDLFLRGHEAIARKMNVLKLRRRSTFNDVNFHEK